MRLGLNVILLSLLGGGLCRDHHLTGRYDERSDQPGMSQVPKDTTSLHLRTVKLTKAASWPPKLEQLTLDGCSIANQQFPPFPQLKKLELSPAYSSSKAFDKPSLTSLAQSFRNRSALEELSVEFVYDEDQHLLQQEFVHQLLSQAAVAKSLRKLHLSYPRPSKTEKDVFKALPSLTSLMELTFEMDTTATGPELGDAIVSSMSSGKIRETLTTLSLYGVQLRQALSWPSSLESVELKYVRLENQKFPEMAALTSFRLSKSSMDEKSWQSLMELVARRPSFQIEGTSVRAATADSRGSVTSSVGPSATPLILFSDIEWSMAKSDRASLLRSLPALQGVKEFSADQSTLGISGAEEEKSFGAIFGSPSWQNSVTPLTLTNFNLKAPLKWPSSLTSLDLRNAQLANQDFPSLAQLKTINFQQVSMDEKSWRSFSQAMSKGSVVESLAIDSIGEASDLKNLANFLKTGKVSESLQQLSIDGLQDLNETAPFFKSLSSLQKLKQVKVQYSGGQSSSELGQKAFAEAINSRNWQKSVTAVELRYVNLSTPVVWPPTLETLSLSYCTIRKQKFAALSKLKLLTLDYTTFDQSSLKTLAKSMGNASALNHVSISPPYAYQEQDEQRDLIESFLADLITEAGPAKSLTHVSFSDFGSPNQTEPLLKALGRLQNLVYLGLSFRYGYTMPADEQDTLATSLKSAKIQKNLETLQLTVSTPSRNMTTALEEAIVSLKALKNFSLNNAVVSSETLGKLRERNVTVSCYSC